MKTKFIVASTVWVLWLATIALWATTFASNATTRGIGAGSGTRMMQDQKTPIHQFENTEDAQAFRTAVDAAIEAKDYTAFKAAHTTYDVDFNLSEEDFTTMLTRRADATTRKTEQGAIRTQSQEALENGDYTTWTELHKDAPMWDIINTEAKFKQLQEMHTYQEKAKTIAEELGLPWPKGEGMKQGMKDGMRQGQGMGIRK